MAHLCPRCKAFCTCHGDNINIAIDTPDDPDAAVCDHCTVLEEPDDDSDTTVENDNVDE